MTYPQPQQPSYGRYPQQAQPPAHGNYGQPAPNYATPGYAPPGYAAPGSAPPGPGPQSGYPNQTGYTVPQGYPAQQGYPGGYQASGPVCRFCGSVPAAAVTFRGHQGMIVIMRFLHVKGPFCRDCGLATFRRMTERTLIQGWWGYASSVITPITVLINLVRRQKVANLDAPVRVPGAPAAQRSPMDPGSPLLSRPMALAGLAIPVVALVILIAVLSSSG